MRSVHLVKNFGVRLQSAESMRKTLRNEQLATVLRAERCTKALSIRIGSAPDIDGDVENRSSQHPHELRLGKWRDLKMQAPNCANLARKRLVVLNKIARDADLLESPPAVSLTKMASTVCKAVRNDKQYAFKSGALDRWKIHSAKAPFALASSLSSRMTSARAARQDGCAIP